MEKRVVSLGSYLVTEVCTMRTVRMCRHIHPHDRFVPSSRSIIDQHPRLSNWSNPTQLVILQAYEIGFLIRTRYRETMSSNPRDFRVRLQAPRVPSPSSDSDQAQPPARSVTRPDLLNLPTHLWKRFHPPLSSPDPTLWITTDEDGVAEMTIRVTAPTPAVTGCAWRGTLFWPDRLERVRREEYSGVIDELNGVHERQTYRPLLLLETRHKLNLSYFIMFSLTWTGDIRIIFNTSHPSSDLCMILECPASPALASGSGRPPTSNPLRQPLPPNRLPSMQPHPSFPPHRSNIAAPPQDPTWTKYPPQLLEPDLRGCWSGQITLHVDPWITRIRSEALQPALEFSVEGENVDVLFQEATIEGRGRTGCVC